MNFTLWRFVLCVHVCKQDAETFPHTKLGVGWHAHWFHSQRLFHLKKTINWGPCINLYLFFGSNLLTLSVEYWLPKPTDDGDMKGRSELN